MTAWVNGETGRERTYMRISWPCIDEYKAFLHSGGAVRRFLGSNAVIGDTTEAAPDVAPPVASRFLLIAPISPATLGFVGMVAPRD